MAEAHAHAGSSDVLRKSLIVLLLVGGVAMLHRFGIPGNGVDPTGMLALGFVVLAAYTFGELVGVVRLPHITGYILAGVLLGPSLPHFLPEAWKIPPFDRGVLNPDVVGQLKLLDTLAICLIALTAGGELQTQTLRSSLRAITSLIAGMITLAWPALAIVLFLGIGPLGILDLPNFGMDDPTRLAALCVVAAVIIMATSPAVTIAVVTSTGAKGPTTQLLMAAVVLMDVVIATLFSVAMGVAAPWLGITSGGGSLAGTVAWHIGGSLIVGVGVGALVAVYLRYVGAELLLFVVGLVYTVAYAGSILELEPILLFIAAGFTVTNFSEQGEPLIHTVERLSMPTYVVFFTLAGAGLHLDALAQMLPLALSLVVARAGLFYAGVQVGGAFGGAPPIARKYGWLGFVSQAGVALGLAMLLGRTLGEDGMVLRTLVISVISMNELVGPVLLKMGLGLAGELPGGSVAAPAPDPIGRHTTEQASEEAVATGSPELDARVSALRADVGKVIGELDGPLQATIAARVAWVTQLRRDWVRHWRDASAGAVRTSSLEEAVARSWRQRVADRAARNDLVMASVAGLVDQLDTVVDQLPEEMHAPLHPEALTARKEPRWTASRRAWLRFRSRWRAAAPERRVPLRDLARYHLSGETPRDLERAAAALASAEAWLVDEARALFQELGSGLDACRTGDPAAAAALRDRMDARFDALEEAVPARFGEVRRRADAAVGRAWQRLANDLVAAGTPDLLAHHRRFGRVYAARTQGVAKLKAATTDGARFLALRLGVFGLELELYRLQAVVRAATDAQGATLAQLVRTDGAEVVAALGLTLQQGVQGLIEAGAAGPGPETAARIRAEAERLQKAAHLAEVRTTALRDRLTDENALGGLLESVLRAAGELSERVAVPAGPLPSPDSELPVVPGATEIPFRHWALRHLEMTVTRDVVALTRQLAEPVHRAVALCDEIERTVGFNADLVAAEIERVEATEAAEAVQDVLVGPLQRHLARLEALRDDSATWPARAEADLRRIVLGEIEALRRQIAEGRVVELRVRAVKEAAMGRLAHDASGVAAFVAQLNDRADRWMREGVGLDRIASARRRLGLRDDGPAVETFGIPSPRVALPVVYKRLFSEQAIEAGEVTAGRQEDVVRVRRLLEAGSLRAAAVVGLQGVGKAAVVRAVAARFEGGVERLQPSGPVRTEEVDRWFREAEPGRLYVVEGLRWLLTARPGGDEPLRRFVEGVLAQEGRSAWLVTAQTAVWDRATELAPLRQAFPGLVRLGPLAAADLSAAVLARHALTGYALAFEPGGDLWWQLNHALARGDAEQRVRDAWFATLHAASGGLLRDALRLWTASIVAVDEAQGVVRIGPVPRPPLAAIEALPHDDLVALRQLARQGWTTVALHAELFGQPTVAAHAHLASLQHRGLVVHEGDFWRLGQSVEGLVHRALVGLGWEAP